MPISAPSDPGFLVLHALRLKGFADSPMVAALTRLPEDAITDSLQQEAHAGRVSRRDGRISGWALTTEGRAEHAKRIASELVEAGAHGAVQAAYRRFREINNELLTVCTDWQLHKGTLNDHTDPGYDDEVVRRLVSVDAKVQPICADLAVALDRFASYGERFGFALERVQCGDRDWFAKPMIDSYHTVWFELHEDLLVTLGIERSKEAGGVTGRFGSMLTAMVTPFDTDGRLDVDGAVTLARHLVAQGNDGLVLAGTTGESPVLTDVEKTDLWRAVAEAVTVPVVAGSGTYDTAHSVELTKTAEACGVAAILAVCPYYNRPSQVGLEAHFRAVAEATSLPVMLYDIPIRTGRKVSGEVLLRLVTEVDNIVAVKDAANDVAAAARLAAAAPDGFDLYSGDDVLTLPLLAVGAVGAVSVAGHWVSAQIAEMIRTFFDGDAVGARRINALLLDAVAFQTSDEAPNPVPAKAMLRELGLPAGYCRLPHVEPPDADLAGRARSIIADLGLAHA